MLLYISPIARRNFMSEFCFTDSLVAFIDILGFKDVIEDKEKAPLIKEILNIFKDNNSEHQEFKQIREKDSNFFRYEGMVFNIRSFSDSIIITHPLTLSNVEDLCQAQNMLVTSIVDEVARFQFIALINGLATRGSISRGDVYIDMNKNVIFGSALNEAITSEQKIVNYPRVIVSKSAMDFNLELSSRGTDPYYRDITWTNYIRDFDGLYFCDSLSLYLMRLAIEKNKDMIDRIRNSIDNGIKNSKNLGILSKWYWLANYFDKTIEWTKKEKFDPFLEPEDSKAYNILNDVEKFNLLPPKRKYV